MGKLKKQGKYIPKPERNWKCQLMGRMVLLGSRSKKQTKATSVWKVKETEIAPGKMGG